MDAEVLAAPVSLVEVQYALALEYGFKSWGELKTHVEAQAVTSKGTEFDPTLKNEFLSAVRENQLQVIAGLIASTPGLTNASIGLDGPLANETDCSYILHYCVSKGSVEMTHLLLEHGADVLLYGNNYKIPLEEAIAGENPDCVRLLLNHGSPTKFMAWDALWQAEQSNNALIKKLVKEKRKQGEILIELISSNHLKEAAEMVELDSSLVNACDNSHDNDKSPLMLAAEKGGAELVELLIRKGANVFSTYGASSRNALTLAVYEEHKGVMRILKEHGAESDDVSNLHQAANKGNLQKVKMYLNKGVDVNAKDCCDQHVLANAFWSGNKELVEYLVNQGADINRANGHGKWAWVSQNIREGDIQTVRTVLDLGYNVNHQDTWGNTLLKYAKQYKQKEIEDLLLEYGAREESESGHKTNLQKRQSKTSHPLAKPLIVAAELGENEKLKQLIHDGAPVLLSHKSFGPRYPLEAAIRGGHLECVQTLLESGSPTHCWHDNCLSIAEEVGHLDILELIHAKRKKEDALIIAIREQPEDEAIRLIENDPSLVNAYYDNANLSPLWFAVDNGNAKLVEKLIEYGANPFSEEYATDVTALTLAIYKEDDEIGDILRREGVESSWVVNYLFTVRSGNIAKAQHYLGCGIDVNAKDSLENHALRYAIRSGNEHMLAFLMDKGLDVTKSNGWENHSWLNEYISKGDLERVQFMLERGYDPNSQGVWGDTLLVAARKHEHENIEKLLLKYGAKE